MPESLAAQRLTGFQDRANSDAELSVIGDFFTVSFSISFGTERYIFNINKGKTESIILNPRFNVATQFGFRGPDELWGRFFSKVPPPLYHDIFAMIMRVPEFTIDGDTLVAMQNARALQRYMAIMQANGGRNA